MRKLVREPLLHFLLLGALLFVLYGWVNGGRSTTTQEIVVTQGHLENLRAQFARAWQRQPSDAELEGLIEQWVRDEVFYREGQALGLDRNDPVVRRRVAQKLEFIADGENAAAPTDAELQAWLDTHRDKYAKEASYTLRQLYFDPARHGAKLDADIVAAQAALAGGRVVAGDSTMLPATLDAAPTFEVTRIFGREFAEALKALPVGEWAGPLRSGFGLHLVKVERREDGRAATLAEAREGVERDLLRERSLQAKEDLYKKLRANYSVRIDAGKTPAKPAG